MNKTEFNPRIVRIERPDHHYRYLTAPNGDWLATEDGKQLLTQGFVNDSAIWDVDGDGFTHAVTGLKLKATGITVETVCLLSRDGASIAADGSIGEAAHFTIDHGPERLPSAYLEELRKNGWVVLTCLLSPSVVDGLQRVGCVDAYEERKPERVHHLAQDPAIARSTAEPLSLWLCREYMQTRDIKLGHSPTVSALTTDDGKRVIQGWHTDFPHLGGTGDRIPMTTGDLVLGMQRNICVSDFKRDNGATVLKLGSHTTRQVPPREWGISTDSYRPGHREQHGVPYGGADTDVIEAPAGTIVLYDARTWHRAGVNLTPHKRGSVIQAIIPGYIMPFMDTSISFKAFLASDAYQALNDRERNEVEKLMVHRISGPAGQFAITIDPELTTRVRERTSAAPSTY
jgi:hypothetical protein